MHRFHVPDMHCGGCLRSVTRALQKVDPHAQVEGDLDSRVVTVASSVEATRLLSALMSAGYPAQPTPQHGA